MIELVTTYLHEFFIKTQRVSMVCTWPWYSSRTCLSLVFVCLFVPSLYSFKFFRQLRWHLPVLMDNYFTQFLRKGPKWKYLQRLIHLYSQRKLQTMGNIFSYYRTKRKCCWIHQFNSKNGRILWQKKSILWKLGDADSWCYIRIRIQSFRSCHLSWKIL